MLKECLANNVHFREENMGPASLSQSTRFGPNTFHDALFFAV